MPRSLMAIIREIDAKENIAKLVGEWLAEAVDAHHKDCLRLEELSLQKAPHRKFNAAMKKANESKERVEELTKAHNNLYLKMEELIKEKLERKTLANRFIKEHSEELNSNDGLKATEAISIIDILHVLHVLGIEGAEVQFKDTGTFWFAINFMPTEYDGDMTAIRIRKSN